MKISSKLNELKPSDLNCNVFDVYSYDGLSMQELLCQFFTKINECIKVSNETIDLASWLVNEGLKIEAVNKLMLLLEDGTLENLINVNLFNTLNTKIENINSQLTHKVSKTDKINSNQLANDLDENKIKLSNLSQEVIQSIKGQFATELYSKSSNTLISGFDFGTLTTNSNYHSLTHRDLITVTDDLLLTITNNYNPNMLITITGYDENSNYLSHKFRQSYMVGNYIKIPTEYKKIRITVEKIELSGATFSSSDEVQIGKGVVFINTEIKDNSIGTEKYADNSITLDKLDSYISDFIKDNNTNIASYPSKFFIDGFDVQGSIQNNTVNNINICNKELISVFELGSNALYIEGDVEGLHHIIAYYDKDKNFVKRSSWSTDFSLITIPEDVYYFRITISHIDASISFENTSLKLLKIKQNEVNKKTIITVGVSGCDYNSINQAVQNCEEGSTILVYPGIYEEAIKAWNKEVSIIGVDKTKCIVKQGHGRYQNPPLEIGKGYVSNMTFIADNYNAEVSPDDLQSKSYAVHVETDNSADGCLTFDNCILISKWNASIGIGTRPNFTLKINNCELIADYEYTTASGELKSLGALYFHPSATSKKGDNQNIIINNSVVKCSGEKVITPFSLNQAQDIDLNNKLYFTSYNTIYWSNINKNTKEAIWYRGGEGKNGLFVGNNIYLTEDSFGNNIKELNYI